MTYISDSSFSDKWSEEIATRGFTMVPNALLELYPKLGLTSAELLVIINIESFRWESDNLPYPTVETLASRTGMSTRTVTRITSTLCKKKLLNRIARKNTSNKYDISPLIDKLNSNMTSIKMTHTQEIPELSVGDDIFSSFMATYLSAKEDPLNNKPDKHFGGNLF